MMFKLIIILLTTIVISVESQTSSDNIELNNINNELALNLLKVLPKNENNLFSPLSITSSLLMLLNGANGISNKELRNVLNIEENANLEIINKKMKDLLDKTTERNITEVLVRLATAILTSNNYPLLESFENNIKNSYKARIESVDFKTNSVNISQELNDWVKEQTNSKIQKLFDSLDSDSALVIANVIYLNGLWNHRFDPYSTAKDNFYNNGIDEPSKVEMMRNIRKYSYITCPKLNSSLIELPFGGNSNVSMIIILPDLINGLNDTTEKLTIDILNEGLSQLRNKQMSQLDFFLPKFQLKTEYDLKVSLQKLGIKTLFDESTDLSGINGYQNLKISKAIHKAVINVTETGVEAAAVTGIIGVPHIWIPPISVKVDRPFLLLIMDNNTGLILFLGQVQQIYNN